MSRGILSNSDVRETSLYPEFKQITDIRENSDQNMICNKPDVKSTQGNKHTSINRNICSFKHIESNEL